MEQVLSIYLPQWDIQLHKRPSPKPLDARALAVEARATRPLLLTRSTARGGVETVARCCPIASALGVRPGMTLADARAACGTDVTVAPFDPDRSLHALHRLARWMHRFSPTVAVDPISRTPGDTPDGLLLDTTGTPHLFGGEHLLLTEIATRLARMGFSSRLAIAPTIGTAWALARYAPGALTVCQAHPPVCHAQRRPELFASEPEPRMAAEHGTRFDTPLDALPVSALRLSPENIDKLHSVGIETIAQLRLLPRESLLHRFGAEVLLRIDQAEGRVPELLIPLRDQEPLTITRPFDGPTLALEDIFLRLQEMLADLTQKLLHQESGIRGLRLHWTRLNAPPITRDLVTAVPTRDAPHLWNLLRPKVETMHMGHGIEAMSLTAFWSQPLPHRQAGIWQPEHADEDRALSEFLDTLTNRWGAESRRVLTAAPAASHVPEEAWAFGTLGDEGTGEGPSSSRQPASPALLLRDRPTCLLDSPEPLEVVALQPDLPPVRVHWRGQWHAVLAASGPERIVTPWWRVPPHPVRSLTRDYYKVETAAGWLWLFRDAEKWFMQGLWS